MKRKAPVSTGALENFLKYFWTVIVVKGDWSMADDLVIRHFTKILLKK
jgi:hypothetical protein